MSSVGTPLYAIQMTSATDGLAAGGWRLVGQVGVEPPAAGACYPRWRRNLLLTRDGGRTWQKLPEKAQRLTAVGPTAWLLQRFDPTGTSPLAKPVLIRTENMGATWQP